MIGRRHQTSVLTPGLALVAVLCCAASAVGGPITTPHSQPSELHHAVHDAAHAVDEAWEVFHQAALSGTLASPAVQTQVEGYLHESRSLLLDARRALDQDDRESVERLVGRIRELTTKAITLSREKKS